MSATVKTEKELADALKRGEDTIEITGDLVKRTVKIRATGKVAWAIAFAAIGAAFYLIASVPVTGGASTPIAAGISAAGTASVVGVLGGAATYSAIAIAVAAGGVGVLTALRGYKEISRTENKLILKRK